MIQLETEVPQRRLRILHLAEAFGGGLLEITRMQAEGLVARGHHVGIAYGVRPETPGDVPAMFEQAVEILPTPWQNRRPGALARAVRSARAQIEAFQPDVIHLQSSIAGLTGALIAGDIPTVYSPQGYSVTRASDSPLRLSAYRAIERFTARRVTTVGACSLSEGAQARALGARRVVVVENGITELDVVQSPREAPVNGEVVAAGRACDQRQPEGVARILTEVADLAPVGWLGGAPHGAPGLRALEEASIPVSGWQPRSEILRRLGAARLYLHWTAWDGLSLSLLEALARDVVVVASDIGPNREVLGPDGVCGSERDAVARIRQLLTDEHQYREALERQRQRRVHYSAARMVSEWEALYLRLADRTPVAVPV